MNESAMRQRRFLRRSDLPSLTGLSLGYFKRAAWLGEGPPFIKLGRAVLYEEEALFRWLEEQAKGGETNDGRK